MAAVAARHLERGDLLLELRLVDDELDEAAAARRRRVVHLVDPVVVLAVALLDPRRLRSPRRARRERGAAARSTRGTARSAGCQRLRHLREGSVDPHAEVVVFTRLGRGEQSHHRRHHLPRVGAEGVGARREGEAARRVEERAGELPPLLADRGAEARLEKGHERAVRRADELADGGGDDGEEGGGGVRDVRGAVAGERRVERGEERLVVGGRHLLRHPPSTRLTPARHAAAWTREHASAAPPRRRGTRASDCSSASAGNWSQRSPAQ